MVSMHTRHPSRWPALFHEALNKAPGQTAIIAWGDTVQEVRHARAKFLVFKKSLREHPRLPQEYRRLGERRSRCEIGFHPLEAMWYAAVVWTDHRGEKSPAVRSQTPVD